MIWFWVVLTISLVAEIVDSGHYPGNLPLNAFGLGVYMYWASFQKQCFKQFVQEILRLFHLSHYNMEMLLYVIFSNSSRWWSLIIFHWNLQSMYINQYAELGPWELQWHFRQTFNILIQENALQNAFCKCWSFCRSLKVVSGKFQVISCYVGYMLHLTSLWTWIRPLTQWRINKMDNILQMAFSNTCS